jgi:tetratricopeptide (TPR) repeat protein
MNHNAELLERAASLAELGNYDAAREVVKEALKNNDRDPDTWYALTQVAESDAERRKAIYQLWAIDPHHPEANFMLDKLKAGTLPPLANKPRLRTGKTKTAEKNYANSSYAKDYMMPAIYTMVAYWVFWLVGLGMNLYFLNEANRLERETGTKQDNVGCLKALAGVYIALPLVAIVFAVLVIFLAN